MEEAGVTRAASAVLTMLIETETIMEIVCLEMWVQCEGKCMPLIHYQVVVVVSYIMKMGIEAWYGQVLHGGFNKSQFKITGRIDSIINKNDS